MDQVRPVFLFSLPRSGSTLLQRMLGSHSGISTTPEPWVLLPQLYSLRERGVYAEYGHRTSLRGLGSLVSALPGGRESYLREVRSMVTRLYSQASDPAAAYFLDKTPRYNLVAREIVELFPEGHFLVLWRNPLAVVASIVDTWLAGRWKLHHHKVDLYRGLEALAATVAADPSRFLSLRYEDLVREPTEQVTRVLSHLGLGWEPAVLTGAGRRDPVAEIGDRVGAHSYDQVSRQSLVKWRSMLASPVRKAWARRYLCWIGRARLALMGYDLEGLLGELEALPPDYSRLPDDVMLTARGVVWCVAEPRIARDKLAQLPGWSRVHSHD
ncbi:MAG: sulfotransferase [Actinomycetota bacterium]|nr:sulfotransferase [Actinomycetota bacterium]